MQPRARFRACNSFAESSLAHTKTLVSQHCLVIDKPQRRIVQQRLACIRQNVTKSASGFTSYRRLLLRIWFWVYYGKLFSITITWNLEEIFLIIPTPVVCPATASERCIRVASLFGRRRCLQLNKAFLHNYGRTSSLLGTNLDLCARLPCAGAMLIFGACLDSRNSNDTGEACLGFRVSGLGLVDRLCYLSLRNTVERVQWCILCQGHPIAGIRRRVPRTAAPTPFVPIQQQVPSIGEECSLLLPHGHNAAVAQAGHCATCVAEANDLDGAKPQEFITTSPCIPMSLQTVRCDDRTS